MAKNDYSRRSKKDVFWGDDDNNSSKSDELDELFREEHKTLEEDAQTNVPEPVYEPEPESVYEPEPESVYEPEPEPEEIGDEDDAYDGDYNSTEIADDAVPFMTSPGWNGLGYAPSVVLENAPDELPLEEQSDANPMPESITVNEYKPQHQSDTRLDINVEKLSQQYEKEISNLVTVKIIWLLAIVGVIIAGFYNYDYIFLFIVVTIVGCLITSCVSQNKYAEIIKDLVKSFKVIDSYSHQVKDDREKVCSDIFRFQEYSAQECGYYREDLTVIKTGDATIQVSELHVSYTSGSGKHAHITPLFSGEYYTFAMPKPYADGVLVCKGTMPVIEPNQYYDAKYRFYAINNNMPNSDFGHITHIVDRLSENFQQDFALYFKDGQAHLIVNTNTLLFFDFGFWDFSVKDKLKRDVPRLAMRVKIAGILTE